METVVRLTTGSARRSLVIVRFALSMAMAITALIGFCLAVWHSVDFGTNHRPLWELSQRSVQDRRLLHSLYVTACLCVAIPFIVVIDRFLTSKQSHRTLVSAATFEVLGAVFCGFVVIAMLGVIVAGSSSSKQLMKPIRPVILELLSNHTFMRREPNARWIFMDEGMLVNYMQTKFSCCGLDGHEDYAALMFAQRHEGEPFPYSCCTLKGGSIWEDPDLADVQDLFLCQSHNPTAIHEQGCVKPFQDWLQSKANFLIVHGSILLILSGLLLAAYVYLLCISIAGQPF
ncbi:hypothetical protein CAPTEDRAFT_212186 [Capitella teleta]|uniref:Tetraspanin n=1 Tax=Capitella teleta TaxID=283909 RepID=R7TRZ5_CAPTE|nr:hypothetical protein CAPTEDRAFT_212186 [Capitella teleta]|eukprot:ELT94266.1 hypothetical protein CAPTEDRAFT_212186 [Capitella teleta]